MASELRIINDLKVIHDGMASIESDYVDFSIKYKDCLGHECLVILESITKSTSEAIAKNYDLLMAIPIHNQTHFSNVHST